MNYLPCSIASPTTHLGATSHDVCLVRAQGCFWRRRSGRQQTCRVSTTFPPSLPASSSLHR